MDDLAAERARPSPAGGEAGRPSAGAVFGGGKPGQTEPSPI